MQCRKILPFCVFLIFTVFCFKRVTSLDIGDCGSLVVLDNFQISNCDVQNDDACNFPVGTTVNVSFSIIVDEMAENFDNLENDVVSYIGGQRYVLPVSPEPCNVITCPLIRDAEERYSARVYIDPNIRPMGGQLLEWVVKTESATIVICFNFKINFISDGSSALQNPS